MITPDELEILRKPEVQEYIREKMGELVKDPHYHYFCTENGQTVSYLLPDCISRDSERPERGLWGMVNPSKIERQVGFYGTVFFSVWVFWPEMGGFKRIDGDTPRLALLKALEWQIGRTP